MELKTLLPIQDKGLSKYSLSFYFFSPAQLHVTQDVVGKDQFLRRVQTYTRFSSPAINLALLTDPRYKLSPLNRISGYVAQRREGLEIDEEDIIYELQTLVNIYRSGTRDFLDLLEDLAREDPRGLGQYKDRIKENLRDAVDVMVAMRELFPVFAGPEFSDQVRRALEWSDEAAGLILERNAIRLFSICKKNKDLEFFIPVIEARVEQENARRIEMNYESAYRPENPNQGETMAYRESVLKKWTQAALYMKTKDSRTPKRMGHILAGAAAGLAMTFAVIATVYAERLFLRNTGPWALLIILSYILKDRIKDGLKEIFGRLMPRILADRIYELLEPTKKREAARSYVIVKFGLGKEQPEDVQKCRNQEANPFSAILPAENVLHYNRHVIINGRILLSRHTRLDALVQVTRIGIEDFLDNMDDPEEIQYRLENGERKLVSGNRVYHIHLIVSLKEIAKNVEPRLVHYCIVMNQTGILRIETR